ncbi:hypothetical protein MKW98_016781 [Papaver atlanticum]|uniref:PAS domain-containing protein n=1 Tax=Papaver atlanticum TaxID=357466 RepID=A0AAD4TJQ4_9MAGN|nr:hypothetical protein MKW98_016781 [Papaver atlanticum]
MECCGGLGAGGVYHLGDNGDSSCSSDGAQCRNRAAERIYGYSASEALGQNINGFIIEEQDVNAVNEILQRNASGENWTGIFPARNKQGWLFQVLATGAPLYDDSGTLVGIICVTIASESFQETMVPDSLGTKPLKDIEIEK